ncbi:hypothetical protein KADA111694_04945 [Kaistella daneshvariae]
MFLEKVFYREVVWANLVVENGNFICSLKKFFQFEGLFRQKLENKKCHLRMSFPAKC